jgi:hypothetical protein
MSGGITMEEWVLGIALIEDLAQEVAAPGAVG